MRKYMILLSVFLVALSCKEDTLEVYNGDNYIHFTPSVNDIPEAYFNFAYDTPTTRESEADIPVEIRLWGYLPAKDFRCRVSVVEDKTNAIQSDYVRPDEVVFRAGYHVDTLWVTVRRKEILLDTDFLLTLKIDDAEGHVVGPSKYDTVTINVSDKITSAPLWWATTPHLGEYSPLKYRILNIFLGHILSDLSEYTDITFKEKALEFKRWWQTNWNTYPYYDADGTTPLYETIPE